MVNTWLREQGRQWFDAIFDLATSLASSDDEAVLSFAYATVSFLLRQNG